MNPVLGVPHGSHSPPYEFERRNTYDTFIPVSEQYAPVKTGKRRKRR